MSNKLYLRIEVGENPTSVQVMARSKPYERIGIFNRGAKLFRENTISTDSNAREVIDELEGLIGDRLSIGPSFTDPFRRQPESDAKHPDNIHMVDYESNKDKVVSIYDYYVSRF